MQTVFDQVQVGAMLCEAGRTLTALRVTGCRPAGYRSNMPEYLRDPEDVKHERHDGMRPATPSPRQIADMDRRIAWIGAFLHGQTEARIRHRRVMGLRMLNHPETERHQYSYRQIGDILHCSHQHASDLWSDGLERITMNLNRWSDPNRAGLCVASGGGVRGNQAPKRVIWKVGVLAAA